MCVRCGTGRIAWCTSPDNHASEERTRTWQSPAERQALRERLNAERRQLSLRLLETATEDELRRALIIITVTKPDVALDALTEVMREAAP